MAVLTEDEALDWPVWRYVWTSKFQHFNYVALVVDALSLIVSVLVFGMGLEFLMRRRAARKHIASPPPPR